MDGATGVPGDYAANIGTTGADYPLPTASGDVHPTGAYRRYLGYSFKEFLDGTSNTILIGEKHVPSNHMEEHPWDCGIFDGHNPVCNTRCGGPGFPIARTREDQGWKFGSYHPGLCQFVFADGSVHVIESNISEVVLGLLVNRQDGEKTPNYD